MAEFIPVQVPERHVLAVYRFLAELEAAGSETANARNEAPIEPGPGWTEDLVQRAFRESSDKMKQGLVLIAEAGEHGITTDELGEQLGYEHGANAVAGMLGAAHRRCRNRYGMEEPLWHADWEYYEPPAEGGTSRLTIDARIREWVRAAA